MQLYMSVFPWYWEDYELSEGCRKYCCAHVCTIVLVADMWHGGGWSIIQLFTRVFLQRKCKVGEYQTAEAKDGKAGSRWMAFRQTRTKTASGLVRHWEKGHRRWWEESILIFGSRSLMENSSVVHSCA